MLSRISNQLNSITEAVCCVFLLAMTLTVALQVICRYVLGAALTWSEEFSRYGLVWIAFLGGSMAVKRGAHMGVEALVNALSPKTRKIVQLFTLCAVIGFLVIATIKGIELALFNMNQHSPAMGVPMGAVYLAIPTGCLTMLIHASEELLALFRSSSPERPGEAID
ncbi:MAG: TRAP transporter small permease [Syntrophobacteria bacterium]|jgi:TRAP-type C4-dicarboxylate transport system permease small subunit